MTCSILRRTRDTLLRTFVRHKPETLPFTDCCQMTKTWADYINQSQTDRKIFKRINQLIADIDSNCHQSIGKPEPLGHEYYGHWSRRTTDGHRLVYGITDDEILFVQCRSHGE